MDQENMMTTSDSDARPKRKYNSLYQREKKEAVIFQITARDYEIIKAVNRFRYLHTFQIARLLGSSVSPLRRRLKLLFKASFLNRYRPYVRVGDSKPPIAYYLGDEGARLLSERGEKVYVYPKSGKVKHLFFDHALDLSEFRIHFELALRNHEKVISPLFLSYFEQLDEDKKRVGYDRYRIFFDFQSHKNERVALYPDGLFVLQVKENPKLQALFLLEIDRSTEGLSVIRKKLVAFNEWYRMKQYATFGEFGRNQDGSDRGFKLLIQCKSKQRVESILKGIQKTRGIGFLKSNDMIRVGWVGDIDNTSILNGEVWVNHENEKRQLVK